MTGQIMTDEQKTKLMDRAGEAWNAAVSNKRYGTDQGQADRMVASFARDIDILLNAVKAGEIANARLEDAKYSIVRTFEKASERARETYIWPISREIQNSSRSVDPKVKAASDMMVQFSHIPSAVRKLDEAASIDARIAPVADVIRDFIPLHDLMTAAKKVAVKRVAGRGKGSSPKLPPVTSKAAKAVMEVLQEFTQASADAIRDRILCDMTGAVDRYLAKQKAAIESGENLDHDFLVKCFTFDAGHHGKVVNQMGLHYVGLLTERDMKGFRSDRYVYVRRADADAIAMEAATKRSKDIQDTFVAKNLAKIAPVCEGRNGVPKVSMGATEISLSTLTGSVVVTFDDGSRFVARNGIVMNVSSRGREFDQFPLRFHDVTFPDGSRKSFASEAQMRKAFAAEA